MINSRNKVHNSFVSTSVYDYLHQLLAPDHRADGMVRLPLYSNIRTAVSRRTFSVEVTPNSNGDFIFAGIPSLLGCVNNIGTGTVRHGCFYYDNSSTYSSTLGQATPFAGYVDTYSPSYMNISGGIGAPSPTYLNTRIIACSVNTAYTGVSATEYKGLCYVISDQITPLEVNGGLPIGLAIGSASPSVSSYYQNEYKESDIQKLECEKVNVTSFSNPSYVWRPRTLHEMIDFSRIYNINASGSAISTTALATVTDCIQPRDVCVFLFKGVHTNMKVQFIFDVIIEAEMDPSITELNLAYTDCYTDPLPFVNALSRQMTNFIDARPVTMQKADIANNILRSLSVTDQGGQKRIAIDNHYYGDNHNHKGSLGSKGVSH